MHCAWFFRQRKIWNERLKMISVSQGSRRSKQRAIPRKIRRVNSERICSISKIRKSYMQNLNRMFKMVINDVRLANTPAMLATSMVWYPISSYLLSSAMYALKSKTTSHLRRKKRTYTASINPATSQTSMVWTKMLSDDCHLSSFFVTRSTQRHSGNIFPPLLGLDPCLVERQTWRSMCIVLDAIFSAMTMWLEAGGSATSCI